MEIWKDIIDYPNYKLSNLGIVINKTNNKNISISVHKQGHHVVRLWHKNKTKLFSLYRLLAIHFIDNLANKKEVNHIDGNRMNYNLSNLEWVTPSENMKHAFKNGLARGQFKTGTNTPTSKLSNSDIIEIKDLRKNKTITLKELSIKFKVSITHISKLSTGYYDRKKILSK